MFAEAFSRWRLLAMFALALLGCLVIGTVALAGPGPYRYVPVTAAPGVLCESISFATPVTYVLGVQPRSATGGDFNRDTHPDVAVSDYSSRSVTILLGNANGTFQPGVSYLVGFHPVSLAMGD